MLERKRLSAAGIAVLLVAAAAPATAHAAEAPELDLNYGVLVALTGEAGISGQTWNHATSTAVEDIANQVEGMGLSDSISVSLVASEDSQGNQTAGIEAAKKLAEVDQADIVIGDFYSSVTIATFESVFKPGNIVQFTGGTNPGISLMEKDGLLWRPVASDALQGQVLAQVMADQFGQDAVVNMVVRNDAYGVGLGDVFKEAWTGSGGSIGEELIFNPDVPTLDTEAQQAVQGDPDAWLLITFCGDWAKLKGPLTRTGAWDPTRTIGSDVLANCVDAEAVVEGMRGTVGNSTAGSSFPAFQTLFEASAPEGLPFQGFTSEAFDSVYLGFLAALQAGSTDPAAIGAEVQSVSGGPGEKYTFEQLPDAINAILAGEEIDFEGSSGPIDFDENGDITANMYDIWVAQADGTTAVESTIVFNPEP
jgi:ABC-type branched-subunit amino acid transport system substrate-binding protein